MPRVQLLGGDAVGRHPGQLGAHHGQDVVELVGQAADRDAHDAGVGVVAGEGEDRVGQPATLADLLEQPARGAAAERGVEDTQREAAVVVAVGALHAEHEVDLLERPHRLDQPAVDPRPASGGVPGPDRLGLAGQEAGAPERALDAAYDVGVVEVARRRDHDVLRPVVAAGRSGAPGPG